MDQMQWPVPEELLRPPQDDAQRYVDPGFPKGKPAPEPSTAQTDEQVVSEESLELWRLLDERTPAHVDDLAHRAKVSAAEALRRLSDLELKGMCVQRPGKYFLRR